jgi:hypothetical protein
MSELVSEVNDPRCPCGERAEYVCDCGCLCCGEDPCAFGCGGSVKMLGAQEDGLTVRRP